MGCGTRKISELPFYSRGTSKNSEEILLEICGEYEENMKKYEKICRNYEKISGKCGVCGKLIWNNMWKLRRSMWEI